MLNRYKFTSIGTIGIFESSEAPWSLLNIYTSEQVKQPLEYTAHKNVGFI